MPSRKLRLCVNNRLQRGKQRRKSRGGRSYGDGVKKKSRDVDLAARHPGEGRGAPPASEGREAALEPLAAQSVVVVLARAICLIVRRRAQVPGGPPVSDEDSGQGGAGHELLGRLDHMMALSLFTLIQIRDTHKMNLHASRIISSGRRN